MATHTRLMKTLGFKRVKFDPRKALLSGYHYYDHPSGVRVMLDPKKPVKAATVVTLAIRRAVYLAIRQLEIEVANPVTAMRRAASEGVLKL